MGQTAGAGSARGKPGALRANSSPSNHHFDGRTPGHASPVKGGPEAGRDGVASGEAHPPTPSPVTFMG